MSTDTLIFAWYRRVRALPVFAADLERTRSWLLKCGSTEQSTAAGPTRVVWRGDQIEWLLAQGYHEWFAGEIRAGRVAWPQR